MKDTELRRERDRALYQVYVRGLRTIDFVNDFDAAAWTMRQPAPQFYMSAHSLSGYLHRMASGDDLHTLHQSTRDKVMKLAEMYEEWMASHPETKLSRELVCEILVEMPAPRFYMDVFHAHNIIKAMRKEEQEKRLRKYNGR